MHKIAYACQFLVAKSLGNWGWYFLFPWIVWGGVGAPPQGTDSSVGGKRNITH